MIDTLLCDTANNIIISNNQPPFLIYFIQQEDMGLPNPQRVVVLPDIEWEKYLGAAEAIEMAGFRHQTRGAKSSGSKYSASAATAAAAAGPSSTSRKYYGIFFHLKCLIFPYFYHAIFQVFVLQMVIACHPRVQIYPRGPLRYIGIHMHEQFLQ